MGRRTWRAKVPGAAVQGEAFAVDALAPSGRGCRPRPRACGHRGRRNVRWNQSWESLLCASKTEGDAAGLWARAVRRMVYGPRVRFSFRRSGPRRQLPLRARSSTGWAGGALRYDGGLIAHRHSRAAPRSPALGSCCGESCVGKKSFIRVSSRTRYLPADHAERVEINRCRPPDGRGAPRASLPAPNGSRQRTSRTLCATGQRKASLLEVQEPFGQCQKVPGRRHGCRRNAPHDALPQVLTLHLRFARFLPLLYSYLVRRG